jgi:L-threonylcarbamoyladenylate synthase
MGDKRAPERLAADAAGIARASELLRAGRLVAVPTETVYGLAARADSDEAVAGIFRAKGRPDFNPLIVHVPSLGTARRLALVDARAAMLAKRYWPGPLTMVLPLAEGAPVARAVTANLPTIALRMPDHAATAALLRALDLPLAAPSANRSGGISPTSAAHVESSLGGAVDAILDGGACPRGVESTIVALRDNGGWQLLRSGPIPAEELAALLGPPAPLTDAGIEAPGQLARHYSPGKPLRLGVLDSAPDEFLIGFGPVAGDCSLSETGDCALAAARLYECLHRGAASDRPRIAVAPVPDAGIGAAINDRLRRAAA